MPGTRTCPHCEQPLRIPDDAAGRRLRCPMCGESFEAPAATEPVDVVEFFPPLSEQSVGGYRAEPIPATSRSRPYRRQPAFSDDDALDVRRSSGSKWWILLIIVGSLIFGSMLIFTARENRFREAARGAAVNDLEQQRREIEAAFCYERGEELRDQRRFQEACVEYRKALDLNPKHADSFFGLLMSIGPDESRDDLARRFEGLDHRREAFVICADVLVEQRKGDLLELLAHSMRRTDPQFADAHYYLSITKAWGESSDDAVRYFKHALTQELDAERREFYVDGFLSAMASVGLFAQAYSAAPSPKAAFVRLANEIKQEHYDSDALRALVRAHRKRFPDDPLLHFYQGAVHTMDGNYNFAQQSFDDGLRNAPKTLNVEEFRGERVLTRYYLGQAMSAYREIGPRDETFEQLANLMLSDNDHAQLKMLIAARVKDAAGDPVLERARLRLMIREGTIAEAIKVYQALIAKEPVEERRSSLRYDFVFDMVEAGKPIEAYKGASNREEVYAILASELVDGEDWKQLKRLNDARRTDAPKDRWLAYYDGEVLLAEEAWAKAAAVLSDAWRNAPEETKTSYRWKAVFAHYKAGNFLAAYAEIGPCRDTFAQLAHLLKNDRRTDDLQRLVALHRTNDPEDPEGMAREVMLLVTEKQFERAARLIKTAVEKKSADYQPSMWSREFALAMKSQDKALEGYQAAPDQSVAFQALAQALLHDKKIEELEALLDAHGKNHSSDAQHLSFLGELHLLRNNLAEADKAFAAALKADPADGQWQRLDRLFHVRVLQGKMVETFRDFADTENIFSMLAWQCLEADNVAQFKAILAEHRKKHPDDDSLVRWEMEQKFLEKDYEAVVRMTENDTERVLHRLTNRWRRDDLLVRSLLQLDRKDEALRFVRNPAKGHKLDQTLVILAHAASGDVNSAVKATDEIEDGWPTIGHLYADEDLGPILRSDAFASFREKYPPPKKDEP